MTWIFCRTEDTFILLDALEEEGDKLRSLSPLICLEIGLVPLPVVRLSTLMTELAPGRVVFQVLWAVYSARRQPVRLFQYEGSLC